MTASDLAAYGWIQAAVLVVLLTARYCRRPDVQERRIRLFEAMAAAARRGVPLYAVAERASVEEGRLTRRALQRVARELEEGAPLADALADHAVLRVPQTTVDVLRSADGSPALADALAAAARDETAARIRSRRPYADVLYLVVVVGFAAPFAWMAVAMLMSLAAHVGSDRFGNPLPDMPEAVGVAWFVVTSVALVVVVAPMFLPWVGRVVSGGVAVRLVGGVPPFRTPARLAGAARFFDALAAHVRAGTPLPVSARSAGHASGVHALRRGGDAFADAVEDGAPASDAWSRVPVSSSLRTRAAAACGAAPAATAAAFERIAAECRSRLDAWVASRARWVAPLGLLVLGLAAGWVLFEMTALLQDVRSAAMPGVESW